jgi:hypothetical protein
MIEKDRNKEHFHDNATKQNSPHPYLALRFPEQMKNNNNYNNKE